MKDTSMDSFLRTIPNGTPVHVSIQNVAVRKDMSTELLDNQPPIFGDSVVAPAVLYVYRDGSTKLIHPVGQDCLLA
jgi:hypothetical protein